MKKRDEFDSSAEAIQYISLDQAILRARTLASEDGDGYRRRLGWDEMAWQEDSAEQREDSFRVVLRFRRPSRQYREQETGEEEFVFNLTGSLVGRQVLAWPEGALGPGSEASRSREEVQSIARAWHTEAVQSRTRARLEQLERQYPVSPEVTQYYQDAFILEPDEWVLLYVPVEFPMSYLGFNRRSGGRMGVTDRRLLFSKRPLFRKGLHQRRLQDAWDVRRRPGPHGIEIGAGQGRYDRVFVSAGGHRDVLAEYIRFEAARSYYNRYL